MADKRAYSSPLREAEAAATRKRIVEAASTLFVRDGYGATTLKAIADEAGVSVQTVHLNGPKPALLMAAYEVALTSGEGFQNLSDTEPMQSIGEEQDMSVFIDRYADFMTDALGRIAELVTTLRAAADTDPAVRDVYRAIEARRSLSINEGVAMLAARGSIPPEAVRDVQVMLSMLVSADNYLHLRNAGWPPERYRAWLRGQLGGLYYALPGAQKAPAD